jgi:ribosomal protein L16/L10AE
VAPPVLRAVVTPNRPQAPGRQQRDALRVGRGRGRPHEMDVKINRGNVMRNRVGTGSAMVFAALNAFAKGRSLVGGVRSSPRTSFNDLTA